MSLTYGFTLGDETTSQQFSDAIQSVTGDGITQYGGEFSLTINGFAATIASGYAMAAGRWLYNTEPLPLTVKASGDNAERTDALVIRADYNARKAFLEIMEDVDPDELPETIRGPDSYSIVLYLIRVPRGTSTIIPEYVTDTRENPELCGTIVPLSSIAGDTFYIFDFLHSGIDKEVDRVVALAQAAADKADKAVADLDAEIARLGAEPDIGEMRTARHPPGMGWLLCDGGSVPAEYQDLSALLGGALPNISQATDRYTTYIYGGI